MIEPRFLLDESDFTAGGNLKTVDEQRIYNVLMNFGLILLPSDTGYALAGIPAANDLYDKINAILNRDQEPLSLSFPNLFSVAEHASIDNTAANLLEQFTPGPLTLVCPRYEGGSRRKIAVQENTRSDDKTIGIRIPDSIIERQVAAITPYPITTAAVRDENKKIVQDFDLALKIVQEGVTKQKYPNWAVIKGKGNFLSEQSTVVILDRVTRDIFVKREGAIKAKDLHSVKNIYSQFSLNGMG
jgi:L-threonylcarbamoyladenylate synthase